MAKAQIDDLTPPGIWADFIISQRSNDRLIVEAIDTGAVQLYYRYTGDSLELIEPDSNFISMGGLGTVDGWSYFMGIDDTDQSHFFRLKDGSFEPLPASGNWRLITTPFVMSDSTLYTNLQDETTGLMRICKLDGNGLTILSDSVYAFVGVQPFAPSARVYHGVLDTMGSNWLAYYDVNEGYVQTDIPGALSGINMITGSPGDATHSFITNATDPLAASGIYRYNGSVLIEETVPAGPYDNIRLLYRNDAASTTYFEVTDFSGNLSILERKSGVWSDITSNFPAFQSTSVIAEFEHDAFIWFKINTGDQLYNFQVHPAGDTIINVTPTGDSYDFIALEREDIAFPATIRFEGQNGEYLYDFFYGLTPLFEPPSSFLNPDGLSSENISNIGHGAYTFQYNDAGSGSTYKHLYHRIAPGNVWEPLYAGTNEMAAYSTPEAIVFYETDMNGNQHFFVYNLDSIISIQFPTYDTTDMHSISKEGQVCLVEGYDSPRNSQTALLYQWNVTENKLIDITHPRYPNIASVGADRTYEIDEMLLAKFRDEDLATAKLFLVKQIDRISIDCNADLKFFHDETTPTIDPVISARHIFFSGFVPAYMAEGSFMDFSVDKSFDMLPGAEISAGMNFTISIGGCDP